MKKIKRFGDHLLIPLYTWPLCTLEYDVTEEVWVFFLHRCIESIWTMDNLEISKKICIIVEWVETGEKCYFILLWYENIEILYTKLPLIMPKTAVLWDTHFENSDPLTPSARSTPG